MTGQEATPEELPRGPHRLPRADIVASQRRRLLQSILDVVGEVGYAAATIAQFTSRAHVSRSSFYEQFDNKLDGFLTAYDAYVEGFFAELVEVSLSAKTPVDGVEACTRTLIEYGRSRPLAARAVVLEIHAAGDAGLRRRDKALQKAEELFAQTATWFRGIDKDLPPLAPGIGAAVIAASFELAAQAVRHDTDAADGRARLAVLQIWLTGLTGSTQADPSARHTCD